MLAKNIKLIHQRQGGLHNYNLHIYMLRSYSITYVGPASHMVGQQKANIVFLHNLLRSLVAITPMCISESESYVAGAHCVLSRHGERFAWVVKREKIVRLLQSSLEGCEGRRQFYIRW